MTSEIDTEIGQISPKFPRNPQSDFTFCLPTLGRHPTFRTLNEIKIVRGLDREENFNDFFFDFMVNSPH